MGHSGLVSERGPPFVSSPLFSVASPEGVGGRIAGEGGSDDTVAVVILWGAAPIPDWPSVCQLASPAAEGDVQAERLRSVPGNLDAHEGPSCSLSQPLALLRGDLAALGS